MRTPVNDPGPRPTITPPTSAIVRPSAARSDSRHRQQTRHRRARGVDDGRAEDLDARLVQPGDAHRGALGCGVEREQHLAHERSPPSVRATPGSAADAAHHAAASVLAALAARLDIELSRFVADDADANDDALLGNRLGEAVAPLDHRHAVGLERAPVVEVFELVGRVEAVEVEVVERDAPLVHEKDVEGRARDRLVHAETDRQALGELRLACTEVTREHDHVARRHERGQRARRPLAWRPRSRS